MVMFAITISTVISILITAATKDIVMTIGSAGAGIVFILGLGFSFMIEQKEDEEKDEEDQGNVF